jgi:small subunit ribosomal protein S20
VEGANKSAPVTFSLVDRAAKWGIIKKNTAARYKSRLTLRLKKLAAA